jgi:hypothetical protein
MGSDLEHASEENFFAHLPEITRFLEVTDPRCYSEAPRSWLVVLTDVRGSTRAIEAGRYRDVNALGVASIVALCNALRDLELPYVFGGDGATVLVPGTRLEVVQKVLRGVKALARTAFELELRAGVVPLSELAEAGHQARVARFRASPHTRLAMFSGSAFSVAERWIKDPERGKRFEVSDDGESEADFEGFECRWQPVASRRGTMVSLLVMALAKEERERVETYHDVLEAIEAIVDRDLGRPVKREGLRFSGFFNDYGTEARVRSKQREGEAFDDARAFARKKTLIGRMLTFFKKSAGGFDGERYKSELVENTDFRKFDETLRMVLDLSPEELAQVRSHLSRERAARRVAFGLHEAPSALITCLVRSYEGDHVHFVDGSDGGYALAAKQLKAQLAETE